MDFIIMLGFKFLFDLLYPPPKEKKPIAKSDDVAAAFWFGTSFENTEKSIPSENFTNNSEYDQTW